MSSSDDHAEHHQDSHSDHHREHDHGLGLARAGERHRGRLIAAFAIIAVFFVVQLVAAFATNSLALLSDAGHMLTDVIGIGMALAAIGLATRFEQRRSTVTSPHTFGLYRLEILAAFLNSLLLFAVAVWVIVEAVRRLGSEPDVLGAPMLVVAVLGLLANLVAFALLRPGAKESVNVEGAYLEVLADTIGSVGVIVAALLLQVFGWTWVDSVAGVVIGIWILPRTWRLGRRAVRILLQSAPEHIDLDRLADELSSLEGVVGVHDLHVWTLTSEMDAASVHLVTSTTADSHAVLDRARSCLADGHGIAHGTFQVEPDDHEGCDDVSW
ncbi:MAG TPA: cation diffusion facilitator family transporter [Ilumatobacteraceae bacterium]|nr:cation diffusion facilitator family transporter [Ilumatobacteraceae bacterium]